MVMAILVAGWAAFAGAEFAEPTNELKVTVSGLS